MTISRCEFLICKLESSNVSRRIYVINICISSVKYSLSLSLLKSISATIEETTLKAILILIRKIQNKQNIIIFNYTINTKS